MANEKIVLSNPTKADIVVYKGDSGRFRITFTAEVGDPPVDITAATWDGDIRLKATDLETLTSFDIVPVVGDPASVDVILTADKSELLPKSSVYDVEMRIGDEVSTIIYGTVTVHQDVSRPETP